MRHSEKYPYKSAHENPSFCWTTESTAMPDWFTSQVRVISVIFICLRPRRDAPSSWPEGNL